MEFIEKVKKHAEKVKALKDSIGTEEATKTSLIMPFFQQVLGYDVFDPNEFCPEYISDVGIKKGEKVDFAIMQDGKPLILVEAKWCGESLEKYSSQLFRYFGVSEAKFGILTNGIIYQFYTDLEEKNKMDLKPFLEINLLNLKERYINELKKFQKETFNVDKIWSTASNLKYSTEIKSLLEQEFANPDLDFIKFIISRIYDGRATQTIVDKFTPLIAKSLKEYIEEKVSERIKIMSENIKPQDHAEEISQPIETEPEPEQEPASKIITTNEEIEYFYAVKYMLYGQLGEDFISYKDTESYFGILLNNNIRKWICRLKLGENKKTIVIADENKSKNGIKYEISSPEDLMQYKDLLLAAIHRYQNQ